MEWDAICQEDGVAATGRRPAFRRIFYARPPGTQTPWLQGGLPAGRLRNAPGKRPKPALRCKILKLRNRVSYSLGKFLKKSSPRKEKKGILLPFFCGEGKRGGGEAGEAHLFPAGRTAPAAGRRRPPALLWWGGGAGLLGYPRQIWATQRLKASCPLRMRISTRR